MLYYKNIKINIKLNIILFLLNLSNFLKTKEKKYSKNTYYE